MRVMFQDTAAVPWESASSALAWVDSAVLKERTGVAAWETVRLLKWKALTFLAAASVTQGTMEHIVKSARQTSITVPTTARS